MPGSENCQARLPEALDVSHRNTERVDACAKLGSSTLTHSNQSDENADLFTMKQPVMAVHILLPRQVTFGWFSLK